MDDAREAWRELVQGAGLEAGACSYCSGEEDMQFHGTDKHDPECPVPVVEAALDERDKLREAIENGAHVKFWQDHNGVFIHEESEDGSPYLLIPLEPTE